MYEKGWGKKLSYIFGVGFYEIVDVINRYTANRLDVQSRRTMVPELWLHQCLLSLTHQLQTHVPLGQLQVLRQRQHQETMNLLQQLMKNMNFQSDHLSGRTSGSLEWRNERGELGKYPALTYKGNFSCIIYR
jgi:peptide-N4-(N-acetyl-beta-glucosaminyl)asparagine amidase